jgi:SPP1 family predicted phage head-tail adaptor
VVTVDTGSKNKRIRIMTPVAGQDPKTGDALPPIEFAKTWASIKPMNGSELYRAQQYVSEANILVTIRYRRGMHESMTVEYAGPDAVLVYEILAILDEEEANVEQKLLCKRIGD